jgi:two-component system, NtrC family, nitrogen regulation sensor histidine kinase NtrY
MDTNARPPKRGFLIFLLIAVPALFLVAWSQASLNVTDIFRPGDAQQTIVLLALSAFVFLAFVIFTFILLRILLKLDAERRRGQLGSRFKTRMVMAFLGLSLAPVSVLFIFAYGLLNRSVDRWFGTPFAIVRKDAADLVVEVEARAEERATHVGDHLASIPEIELGLARGDANLLLPTLQREVTALSLRSAICFDRQGRVLARAGDPFPDPAQVAALFPGLAAGHTLDSQATARWRLADYEFFLTPRPVVAPGGTAVGTVVSITRLPYKVKQMADDIQREVERYDELGHRQKALKRIYLSILGLLTLLILFAATWLAMFVSKQVTVPIQALAEATHEVSQGNLGYQVTVQSEGELGALIGSFNEMTRQLQENRRALEEAARQLQAANRQLEERSNTMEAILENIPTGVVSLDLRGRIARANSTAQWMFGEERIRSARTFTDLFSREDALEIARLFRRASRQGLATNQLELELGGRRAVAAVTISSIRARQENVGALLVLEDLTELLRAQKSAAWREVAQRIAHEIKNPLTPIQLSAERIQRLVERAGGLPSREVASTIAQSAELVGREVATLKGLVDEFSRFARFPASQPVPASLNEIVANALGVFAGRLHGIRVHPELAPDLPPVPLDAEQIKRAVVNLIDNAAEALEHAAHREIWVRTGLDPERDMVEITVADSGPGIPPEAKEKLFLPYFSTKERGTGLGLAIVSRIVSEHQGSIRVEDNQPTGSRFIVELPLEREVAASKE